MPTKNRTQQRIGWLVPRARGGGLTGPGGAAAIAIAIGAVTLVGWDLSDPRVPPDPWTGRSTGPPGCSPSSC